MNQHRPPKGSVVVPYVLVLVLLTHRSPVYAQAVPQLLPGTVAGTATVGGTGAWVGAAPGGVTTDPTGARELLIRQTQPRATLQWQRFNIDRGETVRFDQQGNRNWVALNWIYDQRPSEIAGRLIADGAVYLINQNGIVFKPGAQIDAASFIASSLKINNDAFAKGLTAMAIGQAAFEFDAESGSAQARIDVQAGTVRRLDGTVVNGPDGRELVAAAQINAASGGRVYLLGTREVINNGLVTSPNGQVILAAGQRVYLFAPTPGDSASFRGLFVEVDAGGADRTLGTVTNGGTIQTPSGNTTLMGMAINQNGRISADTAISGNGSVQLLSRANPVIAATGERPTQTTATGAVVLGPQSVIEAQPRSRADATGALETAQDSQTVFASEVRIEGRSVHLQGAGSGGASILAPGGKVSIAAAEPNATATGDGVVAPVRQGRITVDSGASVDVAGLRNVDAPMSRNLVEIQIGGENVADNPTLRTGPLALQTVRVDRRTGSPLFSQSVLEAAANQQIQRTVEERMTTAGAVSMRSDGDLLVNRGANFSIAGGSVRYAEGAINATRLFDGRRTVDIGLATPDRRYTLAGDYVETDARWGVQQLFPLTTLSRTEASYIQGADAGRLEAVAPFVAMFGQVRGDVENGPKQRNTPPVAGLVSFGNRDAFSASEPNYVLRSPVQLSSTPNAAVATLTPGSERTALFGTERAPLPMPIDTAALSRDGVSRVEVFSNAGVTVPAGASVTLPAGGRLTVAAAQVDVRGNITVPAARGAAGISASNPTSRSAGIDLSAGSIGSDRPSGLYGAVRVQGAKLDAAGLWLVDPAGVAGDLGAVPIWSNAGSVRLSGFNVMRFDDRSMIDVSAGAQLNSAGKLNAGKAGSASVGARFSDQDPIERLPGDVAIGGTFAGYGFGEGGGGSVQIQAPRIDISAVQPSSTATQWLDPAFFLAPGMASFALTGTRELNVAPGTQLAVRQRTLDYAPSAGRPVDGTSLRAATRTVLLEDNVRGASSISFNSSSPLVGQVNIGSGALVQVGRGGSISLDSGFRTTVAGRLEAPAGRISLTLNNGESYPGFRGDQGIWLTNSAVLNANGVDNTIIAANGRRSGDILPGGTVTISAATGYVVAEPGSRVTATGASGLLEVPGPAGDSAVTTRTVASAGGKIEFSSINGGVVAGKLDLRGGAVDAPSGELSITQVRTDLPSNSLAPGLAIRPLDREEVIRVVSDANAMPANLRPGGDVDIAIRNGGTLPGKPPTANFQTRVANSTIEGSGAAKLSLQAGVALAVEGDKTLSANRAVSIDAVAIRSENGGTIRIIAPYVELGSSRTSGPKSSSAAIAGAGSLQINSSLASDLFGKIWLQGIGQARLSSDGDLRLRGVAFGGAPEFAFGELNIEGRAILIAQQIFPTTFSDYTVRATGAQSGILLAAVSADPATPLSAGGRVSLSANAIDIQGRLRAPQGTINIDAANSLRIAAGAEVSVSGDGSLVPVGITQDRRSWVYGFNGGNTGRAVDSLDKGITLAGRSIAVEPGARVDASGGGDVLASGFVPGSGGSADVLLRPNVFAIIPDRSGAQPFDFQIRGDTPSLGGGNNTPSSPFRGAMPATAAATAQSSLQVGDSIYLSGSPGLPAGNYRLLPGRYAALPGAFMVALTNKRDVSPDANSTLVDGSALVAGMRITPESGQSSGRWIAVNVLDGAQMRRYSEYVLDTGNRFFAAQAERNGASVSPNLPQDAGRVSMRSLGGSFALSGAVDLAPGAVVDTRTIDSNPPAVAATAARGGAFELAASGGTVEVTAGAAASSAVPGAAPTVRIADATLNALNADRLILGATSGPTTDGRSVTIATNQVVIDDGARLSAGRVAMAATDSVSVGARASIIARGGATIGSTTVNGTGAYVEVASTADPLNRGRTASDTARVTLGDAAKLDGNSITLDALGGTTAGNSTLTAASLAVASRRIVLGDTTGVAAVGTTRLPGAAITGLASGGTVSLTATEAVQVVAGTSLDAPNSRALVIDTPAITAATTSTPAGSNAPTSLTANAIVLTNRTGASGGVASAAPSSNRTLQLRANGSETTAASNLADAPSTPLSGVITLGEGAKVIGGFDSVQMSANRAVRFQGDGSLLLEGALSLNSPQVQAGAGATHTVQAGRLAMNGGAPATPATALEAGAGARLSFTATTIDVASRLVVPSGYLSLNATGRDGSTAALQLRNGASIDARGAELGLFDQRYSASGGVVTLTSALGSVLADSSTSIDVSAATGSRAGSIEVAAPIGRVGLAGGLRGSASSPSDAGALRVDASQINAALAMLSAARAGGLNGEVSLRVRSGDLDLRPSAPTPGSMIAEAGRISLTADRGDVHVGPGILSASGTEGGSVALYAGNQVTLENGSRIEAIGSAGAGGQVTLSGNQGFKLGAARMDVSGSSNGGEVDFRFARSAASSSAFTTGRADVVGAESVYLTGVRSYDTVSVPTISQSGLQGAFTDATTWVNTQRPTLTQAFALITSAPVKLRPEIELLASPASVNTATDLRVSSPIDLSGLRFRNTTTADTAGVLTMRASGDIAIGAPADISSGAARPVAVLSDAFADPTRQIANTSADAPFAASSRTSWSFRMAAGADLGSADPMAVRSGTDSALGANKGSFKLQEGNQIRTGTGSIAIAAARDVLIGTTAPEGSAAVPGSAALSRDGIASIYTMGRSAPAVGGFRGPNEIPDETGSRPAPRAEYTERGGAINVTAGGAIRSTPGTGLAASEWVFRQGLVNADGTIRENQAPTWWVRPDRFDQTFGALGGGTVALRAGTDIENVSAAVASNGRLADTNPDTGKPVVYGGGRLNVEARGSVQSGSFNVMRGQGNVRAGDSIGASSSGKYAPVSGAGDASIAFEARRTVAIDQVYNPTLSTPSALNAEVAGGPSNRSYFSTYTPSSVLSVTSAGGNVKLQEGSLGALVPTGTTDDNGSGQLASVRPGSLNANAVSGDVSVSGLPASASRPLVSDAQTLLAPTSQGGLRIGAARDVTGRGNVVELDTDPARSLSVYRPGASVGDEIRTADGRRVTNELALGAQSPERATSSNPPLAHGETLARLSDRVPSTVYAGRDVSSDPAALNSGNPTDSAARLRIVLAEPVVVRAGRDVREMNLNAQNLSADDVSRVEAGRDVVNSTSLSISNELASNAAGVFVNGPGRVELRAARDIAMGTSFGVVTRGNLDNRALPEQGASVTMIAGLPGLPAYEAFLSRYVDPANSAQRPRSYDAELLSFVQQALPPGDAAKLDTNRTWDAFLTLPVARREEFARTIFFSEVRAAGRLASATTVENRPNLNRGDFQAAYDAMATLYPADGKGNIDLVFSQIKTERGGKVEIMVPGVVCRGDFRACTPTGQSQQVGNLNVGVTNPPAVIAGKKPRELGIFTLHGGDIDVALGNDAAVNRSRVLTAGGGSITMFSAQGDIDAGRGSRTATTAPPPLVRVDKDGNVVVELPGVVEGSGIGVLVTEPGTKPGDVNLFAPKGIIDAGEAGIRSAGNVTVFATEIRNATNISFTGSSVGVPVAAPAPNLALATSTTPATAAGGNDQQDEARRAAEEQARGRSRVLILEFLGFGEEGEEAFRRRKNNSGR